MVVEISNYYVRQVFFTERWDYKLVVWLLVQKMHNYSRYPNRNLFNNPCTLS